MCSKGAPFSTEGSEGTSLSTASAWAPLGPTGSAERLRVRVCSKEASLSATSAWAPLSPIELPEKLRVRACSEGTSLSAASASHCLLQKCTEDQVCSNERCKCLGPTGSYRIVI